jgi:hypothetical protein
MLSSASSAIFTRNLHSTAPVASRFPSLYVRLTRRARIRFLRKQEKLKQELGTNYRTPSKHIPPLNPPPVIPQIIKISPFLASRQDNLARPANIVSGSFTKTLTQGPGEVTRSSTIANILRGGSGDSADGQQARGGSVAKMRHVDFTSISAEDSLGILKANYPQLLESLLYLLKPTTSLRKSKLVCAILPYAMEFY